MNKYIEIAHVSFKAQIAFRFDIAMTYVFAACRILFASLLWGAIFAGKATIAGFTLSGMLSYYVMSAFLNQLDLSDGVSGEISSRIRDGSFSKYMVVPVDVSGYFAAQTFGAAGFYIICDLLSCALWTFVFGIEFALTADIAVIACAIAMVIIGLYFMVQLNVLLGVLVLKFNDISIFLMIKNNLLQFLTGALIPLALLPDSFVWVMRVFPFYYVTYLPAMLFTGHEAEWALPGLLILAAWTGITTLLARTAYQVLRVRYDGVGI